MKKRLWNSIKNGCVLFSVVTLITYTIGALISSSDKAYIPSLKSVYLYLFFSVVFAITCEIFRCDTIKLGLRIFLHYLSYAALCFLVIVLGGGFSESGFITLIIMFALTLIYAAVALIVFSVISRKRKVKNEEEEYTSVFK